MDSCMSQPNKLLSNLYVDYFRTSGPCKVGQEVIYTFQKYKQKMSPREAKKTIQELCKSVPVLCEKEEKRDSRFFLGLGQKFANSIQEKLFKMFNKFNAHNYHGYHFAPLIPYPLMYPIHPPHIPHHHHHDHHHAHQPLAFIRYPPSPPSIYDPALDPYGHGPLIYHHIPPSPGYYPFNIQHLIRGSSQKDPPFNSESCTADNSCKQSSLVKSSSETHSIVKRGVCEEVTDVVFPMIGRTLNNNSTVKILQDFTKLIQPVFYKLCRSERPAYAQGRCVQEFLPVNFFVNSKNAHLLKDPNSLPQEFVLVESGCKFRDH